MSNDLKPENSNDVYLLVSGITFTLQKPTDQRVHYQAEETRTVADICVTSLLVHDRNRGWWAGIRLNGLGPVWFKRDGDTLFFAAEQALEAVDEFLLYEQEMKRALAALQKDGKERLVLFLQPTLQANGSTFVSHSSGADYDLYIALEKLIVADKIFDVFLEHTYDMGWWSGLRLKGQLRIQFLLDDETLFPTPEMALVALEEFARNEEEVRAVLESMRQDGLDTLTLPYVPHRPHEVVKRNYYSPTLLRVNGSNSILYHITSELATYRVWDAMPAPAIYLTHEYGKGWTPSLQLNETTLVMFEQDVRTAYSTAEQAFDAASSFRAKEKSMSNLTQLLKEIGTPRYITIRASAVRRPHKAKPPVRIERNVFVWQRETSEGDLYKAHKATWAAFTFLHVVLVRTKEGEWLSGLEARKTPPIIFEKEEGIAFASAEAAIDVARQFIRDKISIGNLQYIRNQVKQMQSESGRYDQVMKIQMSSPPSSEP